MAFPDRGEKFFAFSEGAPCDGVDFMVFFGQVVEREALFVVEGHLDEGFTGLAAITTQLAEAQGRCLGWSFVGFRHNVDLYEGGITSRGYSRLVDFLP